MTTTYVSTYVELENLVAEAMADGKKSGGFEYGHAEGSIDGCFVEARTMCGKLDHIVIYYKGEEFFAYTVDEAETLVNSAACKYAERLEWEMNAREWLREAEAAAVANYRNLGEWFFPENYSDIYKDVYGHRPRFDNAELLACY